MAICGPQRQEIGSGRCEARRFSIKLVALSDGILGMAWLLRRDRLGRRARPEQRARRDPLGQRGLLGQRAPQHLRVVGQSCLTLAGSRNRQLVQATIYSMVK